MKKTLNLILVMLLMLATLTGCVNIDYTVKVNNDGSGDITYIYAVQKSILETLEMSADDLIGEMKKEVQDSKYVLDSYETDTEVGFKASKHIANVTTEFSLEEAFGKEYVTDNENNVIKIDKTSGKTKYSQNALIDLSDMADMEAMGITMKYSVSLPTKIDADKTNGLISEDGKTVTWDLKIGEVNEIAFEATTENTLIWIICGSVVGVLLIPLVIILIVKKKQPKEMKKETNEINDEQ